MDRIDVDYQEGNDDFTLLESSTRHVQYIMEGYAGWFKNAPSLGVGIIKFTGSPIDALQGLKREIRIQLKLGKITPKIVDIRGNNIFITGQ